MTKSTSTNTLTEIDEHKEREQSAREMKALAKQLRAIIGRGSTPSDTMRTLYVAYDNVKHSARWITSYE